MDYEFQMDNLVEEITQDEHVQANLSSEYNKIQDINKQITNYGQKSSPTSANEAQFNLMTSHKLNEIQERKAEGTDESGKNTGSGKETSQQDISLDKPMHPFKNLQKMDSIPNSQWNAFLDNVSYERLSVQEIKSQ